MSWLSSPKDEFKRQKSSCSYCLVMGDLWNYPPCACQILYGMEITFWVLLFQGGGEQPLQLMKSNHPGPRLGFALSSISVGVSLSVSFYSGATLFIPSCLLLSHFSHLIFSPLCRTEYVKQCICFQKVVSHPAGLQWEEEIFGQRCNAY